REHDEPEHATAGDARRAARDEAALERERLVEEDGLEALAEHDQEGEREEAPAPVLGRRARDRVADELLPAAALDARDQPVRRQEEDDDGDETRDRLDELAVRAEAAEGGRARGEREARDDGDARPERERPQPLGPPARPERGRDRRQDEDGLEALAQDDHE